MLRSRGYPVLLACTAVSLLISYAVRVEWEWLHAVLQTYPSDIWYTHDNYGYFLVNQGFFRMEYQSGYFVVVKAISLLCQVLFPATESTKHGALIYSYQSWLATSSVILAFVAAWMTWCLHRLDVEFYHVGTGRLVAGLLLTPTFAWFSLFNYDLLPLGCCVAALLYLLRGRPFLPFVLLGAGAALKTFPALLLVPFVLRLPREQRLGAVVAFAATLATFNVPFMLVDFAAWKFPYTWQWEFDTTFDQTGRPFYHVGKWASWVLCGGLSLAVVVKAALSSSTSDARRLAVVTPHWLAECTLLLITAFILSKSVFSPQYVLWLLPWMALVTRFPWWGAATPLEVLNIGEVLRLDYWRSGHMTGLVWIRAIRDVALIALLVGMAVRLLESRPAGPSLEEPP